MRRTTNSAPIQRQGSKEFMERKLPVPRKTGAARTAYEVIRLELRGDTTEITG